MVGGLAGAVPGLAGLAAALGVLDGADATLAVGTLRVHVADDHRGLLAHDSRPSGVGGGMTFTTLFA